MWFDISLYFVICCSYFQEAHERQYKVIAYLAAKELKAYGISQSTVYNGMEKSEGVGDSREQRKLEVSLLKVMDGISWK